MFDKSTEVIGNKLNIWLENSLAMLPNIVLAIAILALAIFINKATRASIKKILNRVLDNKTVIGLFSRLLSVLILGLGLFSVLSVLSLDKAVTSILAGAGVIGIALGFAFQEIMSNFVAGVLISFQKPYEVEDVVEIDGITGRVMRIDLRVTLLRTFEGLEVLVPNKTMYTSTLINYTLTADRRINIQVGVSYGDDLEKVEQVALKALENVRCRTDRPIELYFHAFGDSSINFVVQVWIEYPGINNYWKAHHDIITNLKKAFNENDITIPFPIRTLDFGIKGGEKLNPSLLQ